MSICQLRVTHLSINQYFVKTKQNIYKKRNIMHRKQKFEPHRALHVPCRAEKFILPARWWRQKSTFLFFPNYKLGSIQHFSTSIHETP